MKSYRIGNWSQYNKSLINRGSLTFWVSEDALRKWQAPKKKGETGRPLIYSDDSILCCIIVRFVYHLALRSLEGFLLSLFQLLKVTLPVPSYTQICRRGSKISLPKRLSNQRPADIVFDGSGLKVYGEGEWKVRQHGTSKRRIWKKIHIGMCPNTHKIYLCELTDKDVSDATMLPKMLPKCPRSVRRVFGDGIYDTSKCHEAIFKIGAEPIIPPRKTSKYRNKVEPWWEKRNSQVLEILGLQNDDVGRSIWKILVRYHKRSNVEAAFSRLKRILGHDLKGRKKSSQQVESFVKCMILNQMAKIGMPNSYPIEKVI